MASVAPSMDQRVMSPLCSFSPPAPAAADGDEDEDEGGHEGLGLVGGVGADVDEGAELHGAGAADAGQVDGEPRLPKPRLADGEGGKSLQIEA